MKQINLIPWREQAREQRKRQFLNLLIAAVLVTLLVLAGIHFIYANALGNQNTINRLYEQEINQFNQQLEIIKKLKDQQQALAERIDIIDKLQANRTQTVYIFSDMVKAVPEGVYLMGIKRQDDAMLMVGRAESNARISAFMRNLEALSWLEQASLSQIQTNAAGGGYANDFSLELKVKSLAPVVKKKDQKDDKNAK